MLGPFIVHIKGPYVIHVIVQLFVTDKQDDRVTHFTIFNLGLTVCLRFSFIMISKLAVIDGEFTPVSKVHYKHRRSGIPLFYFTIQLHLNR